MIEKITYEEVTWGLVLDMMAIVPRKVWTKFLSLKID
jgi:hypothetical protein